MCFLKFNHQGYDLKPLFNSRATVVYPPVPAAPKDNAWSMYFFLFIFILLMNRPQFSRPLPAPHNSLHYHRIALRVSPARVSPISPLFQGFRLSNRVASISFTSVSIQAYDPSLRDGVRFAHPPATRRIFSLPGAPPPGPRLCLSLYC